MHDNWSFGFLDVPFGKKETIAANSHIFKFCKRAFMVISIPIVFSQTLHKTSDRYIKKRNDRNFENHYIIIIHKSFNYSNTQTDMLYLEFFNDTTNEI